MICDEPFQYDADDGEADEDGWEEGKAAQMIQRLSKTTNPMR
jgi:hypothetical protein